MQHWHLPTVDSSTDKRDERAAGSHAPRIATSGRAKPQVLFSHAECRGVLIELSAGEQMDDHAVRERAVIQVVAGRVTIEVDGAVAACAQGSLVCLEPSERHAVRALDDSRVLLLLAPWETSSRAHDPERLPPNATADPASV
jgi:quercetin dioxygenase-like cupin family protein